MGATGKRKLLSSKEKNRLIKEFLDLRAAPHKNRFYQQKRAALEEQRAYRKKEKLRQERERAL